MEETTVKVTQAGLLDLAREAYATRQQEEAREGEQAAERAAAEREQRRQDFKVEFCQEFFNQFGLELITPDDSILLTSHGHGAWQMTPDILLRLNGSQIELKYQGWEWEKIRSLAGLGYYVASAEDWATREAEERAQHEAEKSALIVREPSPEELAWREAHEAGKPVPPSYTHIHALHGAGIHVEPGLLKVVLHAWGLTGDVALRIELEVDEARDLRHALGVDGKVRFDDGFLVCEGLSVTIFLHEWATSGHVLHLRFEEHAFTELQFALLGWLDYVDAAEDWSKERYEGE